MTTNRYGWPHQQRRAALAAHVNRGDVVCWRCGKRIRPGTPWDLGHHDTHPNIYMGPEHRRCNRGAPWRRRDALRRLRRANPPQPAPALAVLFGPKP